MDFLEIDPCIPREWEGFQVKREWRGAVFHITVKNPSGVMKGVKEILLDGSKVDKISVQERHSEHQVTVIMG